MRLVYITCVLLATTVTCFPSDNAGTTQGDTKSTKQEIANLATTAAPLEKPSLNTTNTVIASDTNNTNSITTNATCATNTTSVTNTTGATNTTIVPANCTDIPTATNSTVNNQTESKNTTTTIHPTEPSVSTPTIPIVPTTIGTITTTNKTLPNSTTTKTPTTTNTVTTVSSTYEASVTPVPTKDAPPSQAPYKERHFDGLSFLGGIILVTCLMGIGLLSWKFYNTFSERHYRTL